MAHKSTRLSASRGLSALLPLAGEYICLKRQTAETAQSWLQRALCNDVGFRWFYPTQMVFWNLESFSIKIRRTRV